MAGRAKKIRGTIGRDVDLWDGAEHVMVGGPLWALWDLLDVACWPDPTSSNGMGRTTLSKLLAAKRPRLVPIYDSVVSIQFPQQRV